MDSSGGEAARQRKKEANDASNSFHAFLSRQNKMEINKLRRIDAIQARYSRVVELQLTPSAKRILRAV